MVEMSRDRFSLQISWPTLLKIITAIALVWLWVQLWTIVMLVLLAVIVAVGLWPVVSWLERGGSPRWLASAAVVIVVFGFIVGFLVLTWSSLSAEAQNLSQRIESVEQAVLQRAPQVIVDVIEQTGGKPDATMLARQLGNLARGIINAFAFFVLASILVLYLLIEAEPTYRWIRGFVPARRRQRFDRTALQARDVAFGFIAGNIVTSCCAAVYVYVILGVMHVPAALLLALLAFVSDFIPVVGFFVACLPAMIMAATQSAMASLLMVPIYLFYHFLENYFIGPHVYGDRLRLSKVAILIAFAVGAELAGVIGALMALPFAAVYPTIERLWLRRPFGDDVVEEHESITAEQEYSSRSEE